MIHVHVNTCRWCNVNMYLHLLCMLHMVVVTAYTPYLHLPSLGSVAEPLSPPSRTLLEGYALCHFPTKQITP